MSKRKRPKRLFPKRYASDLINTSQGVDQNKVQAYGIYANRQRVRTTQGRREEQLPVLNNTFTQEIPKTFALSSNNPEACYDPTLDAKDLDKLQVEEENAASPLYEKDKTLQSAVVKQGWNPSPRLVALRRRTDEIASASAPLLDRLYRFWEGGRTGHGIAEYQQIILKNLPGYKLVLYFLAQEWLFVSETEDTRWVSKVYPNREAAYAAHLGQRISWVTQDKINQS